MLHNRSRLTFGHLSARFALLAVAILSITSAPARAQSNIVIATDVADQPVIHTQLVPGPTANGQTQLAWVFNLAPGWHIYWKNPGDSGLQPELKSPDGTVLPLAYPAPDAIDLPGVTTYGFHGRVVLLTQANLLESSVPYTFSAQFLYCKDICLPGSATFTLPNAQAAPEFADLLQQHSQHNPRTLPQPVVLSLHGQTLHISAPTLLNSASRARFIPAEDGWLHDNTPQSLENRQLLATTDPQATMPLTQLAGVLWVDEAAYLVPPTEVVAGGEMASTTNGLHWWQALGLALLAGLLLNLMPCVLPVLSLKVLSLVKAHSSANRLKHAGFYTLGILSMFWLLALVVAALQAGGAQLGWGFQLQNPVFVGFLALVLVAVALNFFGVFQVGQELTRFGAAPAHNTEKTPKHPYLASLATGWLAVVVATPCTVPFMGGAVAYALGQGLAQSLLIFSGLGLGLALPFLALAMWPKALKWLPKPGPWMMRFKQWLGWPMLLTAVWLLFVLMSQTNQLITFVFMGGVVGVAMLLWWLGLRPSAWRAVVVLSASFILLLGLHGWLQRSASPTPWQAWSPAAVEAGLATQRPVFVDFTADWCLTCKVTEATVLNSPAAQKLFEDNNVLLLRGDWTKRDPEIAAELARHGRRGVPLYLMYQPNSSTPTILPQLLTIGILRDALSK